MTASSPMSSRRWVMRLILIAAWFGMAAGLAEGLSYLILQSMGWLSWETRLVAVDPNILWASPLVDVSLFLLIALLLLPFMWFMRRFDAVVLATGLFATATYYSFLGTSGRIQGFGMVMLSLGLGVATARWMSRNTERGLVLLRRTFIPLLGVTV